jgi:DNA polymerase (family 10)
VHNADIAAIFDEIADLLEIQGANPFRVRAYRKAARTTGELGRDLTGMVAAGSDLEALPGIGEDLAAKIREIVTTGRCSFLERLHHELPPAVTELLGIPGLGPKRVRKLHDALGVRSLPELAAAAASGRIASLEGFGPRTEQHIREALATHVDTTRRFLRALAAQYAEPLAEYLRGAPGVEEVVVAGSYRRLRETVGDIDILVTTQCSKDVIAHFTRYDEVRTVQAAGDTRATVVLACGLQVDLRVVPPESFGAALHYFTGSKAHNIAVRKLAQARGLKLNEYGVFRGSTRVGGDTEAAVFEAVGLPWIPPELREDRGEIEAARAGSLPQLVALEDLRGDLHAHTKASDGRASLREMAEAARARGLQYLAITDHSQRLKVAHGLDPARLARQGREIARLNEELRGIRLLHGAEVDILEDGSLDLPDDALAGLDLVVAALHLKLDLPQPAQTARVLEALANPRVDVLAHPTARLIGERPAAALDMAAVIRAAKAGGTALEIDAQPQRLDLDDVHCRLARDAGVLLTISSDAHSTADLQWIRYGVDQARRGWIGRSDVLNTRPLREVLAWLAQRRKAARPRSGFS